MNHLEEGCGESEPDLEVNETQEILSPKTKVKKTKPVTHEDSRSGVIVSTYKENNRTYCDLKVEIPRKWKDYTTLKITTIIPNNDPTKVWYPFCQEVKD